jgi:hypothetical protein
MQQAREVVEKRKREMLCVQVFIAVKTSCCFFSSKDRVNFFCVAHQHPNPTLSQLASLPGLHKISHSSANSRLLVAKQHSEEFLCIEREIQRDFKLQLLHIFLSHPSPL